MTNLRQPKATAKQVAARRAAKRDKPPIHLMPNGLKLRIKAWDARSQAIADNINPTGRICNAAMKDTTYVPGDGEVVQELRPGAMHAYTLPSRGWGT